MKNLQDYKEQYENLGTKKNLKGEEALKVVKQDGYALPYVLEQTEEICLEAVKQNGFALQYVLEQTEEICLEAVKQDGYALQYVEPRFFEDKPEKVVIDGKEFSKETIKEALKSYINF